MWVHCANMLDMCKVRVAVIAMEEHLAIKSNSNTMHQMCQMSLPTMVTPIQTIECSKMIVWKQKLTKICKNSYLKTVKPMCCV